MERIQVKTGSRLPRQRKTHPDEEALIHTHIGSSQANSLKLAPDRRAAHATARGIARHLSVGRGAAFASSRGSRYYGTDWKHLEKIEAFPEEDEPG